MPTQRCLSVSQLVDQVENHLHSVLPQKNLLRCNSQPNISNAASKDTIESVEVKKKIKPRHKKKKKFVLSANLALTKYNIVKQVFSDFGFNILETTTNDCLLIWSDSAVPVDKIAELKSYQKINHFAGMGEICRKDSLARNIWRVQRVCPDDFNFVPQTWVLPGEYAMFHFQARELKKKKRQRTYIHKPVNGAMGHGIWLTRNVEKITAQESCIIQEYLDKPLLMDGFKFDLRMYVLVTSCDPLKIFLFKDGLVRMGTEPYVAPTEINITHSFMHLTNYSINKHSDNFVQTSNSDQGSKRTLKYFWKWLKDRDQNVDGMWNRISDVIIKTLLIAEPHLFHAYHMCRGSDPIGSSCCFEILGFDIFIDRKYKPWIIEVNRAPSFGTDQDLDYEIKHGVLSTTLKLLNIKVSDRKRSLRAEKIEVQKRLMGTSTRKSIQTSNLTGNKKELLQKRKKDLKWRLTQIRQEAERVEYEDRNMGDFVRIYPPSSKPLCDYYSNLLSQCTKVITGRTSLQRDTNSQLESLKEEEVLDLLQEVENDVLHLIDSKGRLVLKGPAPLSSMPTSQKTKRTKPQPTTVERISSRPTSNISAKSETLTIRRKISTIPAPPVVEINSHDAEKTNEALQLLLSMKIKFPGKSDEKAKQLLDQIQENWKLHRPRVAAYWLVKLDAIKRRKVIDIVKGNVFVILQRVWKDIESTTLYRMFCKLFNRLLWSHGQGLWNCFNTSRDPWDTIFVKNSEKISQTELQCCRQVVKLCRDCLLVVYQFASETRVTSPILLNTDVEPTQERVTASRSYQTHERRIPAQLSTGHLMGTKIAKLYK